jgi:hypothetical protein
MRALIAAVASVWLIESDMFESMEGHSARSTNGCLGAGTVENKVEKLESVSRRTETARSSDKESKICIRKASDTVIHVPIFSRNQNCSKISVLTKITLKFKDVVLSGRRVVFTRCVKQMLVGGVKQMPVMELLFAQMKVNATMCRAFICTF